VIVGNNQFIFNQATMMAMVEKFINDKILEVEDHIRVTSIDEPSVGEFRVRVAPMEPTE
jgi:methionine synthase II (cobalamin-independent)